MQDYYYYSYSILLFIFLIWPSRIKNRHSFKKVWQAYCISLGVKAFMALMKITGITDQRGLIAWQYVEYAAVWLILAISMWFLYDALVPDNSNNETDQNIIDQNETT